MTAIRFFAAALALMFSFSVAAQDAPAPPAKKVVLLAGATGKNGHVVLQALQAL